MCFTKALSLLLTNILTAVKEKLETYCATTFARSGVNQMGILKNSKEQNCKSKKSSLK
jgi:hypothetical protein